MACACALRRLREPLVRPGSHRRARCHTTFSASAWNRRRLLAAQEDGVEMPDLNLSITGVASPSKG